MLMNNNRMRRFKSQSCLCLSSSSGEMPSLATFVVLALYIASAASFMAHDIPRPIACFRRYSASSQRNFEEQAEAFVRRRTLRELLPPDELETAVAGLRADTAMWDSFRPAYNDITTRIEKQVTAVDRSGPQTTQIQTKHPHTHASASLFNLV